MDRIEIWPQIFDRVRANKQDEAFYLKLWMRINSRPEWSVKRSKPPSKKPGQGEKKKITLINGFRWCYSTLSFYVTTGLVQQRIRDIWTKKPPVAQARQHRPCAWTQLKGHGGVSTANPEQGNQFGVLSSKPLRTAPPSRYRPKEPNGPGTINRP